MNFKEYMNEGNHSKELLAAQKKVQKLKKDLEKAQEELKALEKQIYQKD